MAKYVITSYEDLKGVDLQTTDIARPVDVASDMLNAQRALEQDRQSIEKRLGYQMKALDTGGYGLGVYKNRNLTTGVVADELICVDTAAHKLTESSITITYTGTENSVTVDIKLNTTSEEYELILTEGGTAVLTYGLGVGYDDTSTKTMADLRTAVDAISNFTMTIAGITTAPAATLDLRDTEPLSSGSVSIPYFYWTALTTIETAPLSGNSSNRNSADFENTTFVNLNDVLYISNGYDDLLKYDGQTVYKAGMTTPSTSTSAAQSASGSNLTGDYLWQVTYVQVDAKGNTVEGAPDTMTSAVTVTSKGADVTVDNLQAADGFNTLNAVVAGAQAAVAPVSGLVTLNVDNGSGGAHSLNAGDTAYFFNSHASVNDYKAYTIDSVTASTIVLETSDTISVTDNLTISNNLRIRIYRTKAGGSLFYRVADIPNDALSATSVFLDDVADANITELYVPEIKTAGLPPKGRYITAFQNQIIISGNLSKPDRVYWSDTTNINNPESFPAASNAIDVRTRTGDKVTGLAALNDAVLVFKAKAINYITGDFAEDNVRVETISQGDVGCAAHATIQEVGQLIFFMSDRGVFSIDGAQAPVLMSREINPLFVTKPIKPSEQRKLKRAIALNYSNRQQYILYIPSESTTVDNHANDNSRVYVYDYMLGFWYIWSNMNMSGGIAEIGDELFWVERRYSSVESSVVSNLYRQHRRGTSQDYSDHNKPINFNYSTGWESIGSKDGWKKFLRVRISSYPDATKDVNGDISVTTELDYQSEVRDSQTTFTFTDQGSGWGEDAWGDFQWGGTRDTSYVAKLLPGKAKSMRLVFTNDNADENILISGIGIESALAYTPRVRL